MRNEVYYISNCGLALISTEHAELGLDVATDWAKLSLWCFQVFLVIAKCTWDFWMETTATNGCTWFPHGMQIVVYWPFINQDPPSFCDGFFRHLVQHDDDLRGLLATMTDSDELPLYSNHYMKTAGPSRAILRVLLLFKATSYYTQTITNIYIYIYT